MADYSDLAFSIGYKMDMVGKYYNNGHGRKSCTYTSLVWIAPI